MVRTILAVAHLMRLSLHDARVPPRPGLGYFERRQHPTAGSPWAKGPRPRAAGWRPTVVILAPMGLYRLRKNSSPRATTLRITTPALSAPPLLNQEGSYLETPLLR